MNKKSAVSLGPGASSLILIFVILALAVLSMLSLMTSRNDLKFSERSAAVIASAYALNETAEARKAEVDHILAECAKDAGSDEDYLAAVAEELPEDMEILENEISWSTFRAIQIYHPSRWLSLIVRSGFIVLALQYQLPMGVFH